MRATWFEQGEAKGRELERRQSLPLERLSQMLRAVVKAKSLQELGLGE